jgi:hypothetical protein
MPVCDFALDYEAVVEDKKQESIVNPGRWTLDAAAKAERRLIVST